MTIDPVYIRLVAYVLSTLLAMIPASWAGWVAYDATTQMLQISVPGLTTAIVGGLTASAGIFKVWGKK